jgi:signal transduction histidine kinase
MEDISLHILDIVENSIRAHAKNVEIKLVENMKKDLLLLEIIDDGDGMDEMTRKKSTDPFVSTKEGKEVGLGLSLLEQSAEESEGKVLIESMKGKGTKVTATFRLSHIDRKPLGNLDETMNCLKVAHPEIHFSFEHIKADN